MWYYFKTENELRKIAHRCSGAGFSIQPLKDLLSLYATAKELYERSKRLKARSRDAALMVYAGIIIDATNQFASENDQEGLYGVTCVKDRFIEMMLEKEHWYDEDYIKKVVELIIIRT